MSVLEQLAQRLVTGLGVRPGEVIEVREGTGRSDLLPELLLAIETIGATPLLHYGPAGYHQRLLNQAPLDYLANWDRHRAKWLEQADRILVLGGANLQPANLLPGSLAAWQAAEQRLTEIEERRRLPFLVAAIPTPERAEQLQIPFADLEAALMPALLAPAGELQHIIGQLPIHNRPGRVMTIRTGNHDKLHLALGSRPWLSDDGFISESDQEQGAIVSNLPAGSIYTTVLEEQTEGSISLPKAGPATNVRLHFQAGRIVAIDADENGPNLAAWLDRHTGHPRRIGHIGVGLNPHLHRPIGWTLVDEHVWGYLFLSLGENRYMGGQNESSLNVDFAIPGVTVWVDDQPLLENGRPVIHE